MSDEHNVHSIMGIYLIQDIKAGWIVCNTRSDPLLSLYLQDRQATWPHPNDRQ